MKDSNIDIFERMKSGEAVPFNDPQYKKIFDVVAQTMELSVLMNNSTNVEYIREILENITGKQIDDSTRIFTPFHTNFGKFITLGKNVFINHDCSFLDMGGITIEDEVLIGPKVSILTEEHPINPKRRRMLRVKPVIIKKNVWIGAAVTILPGVTIGENSIIASGAVVNKDVPANTIVGGIPARIIKEDIDKEYNYE